MKRTRFGFGSGVLSLAAAGLCAVVPFTASADEPVTANWRGGSTQFLYYPANWVGGVVPGRVEDKNQSPVVTNGTWGSVMVFGAVESTWPNDLRTATGGIALLSTGKMIFRGSTLIQLHTAQWQSYRVESGGGIYVESDAAHVPYFVENSSLHFVKAPGTGDTITIRNDSPNGPLLFRQINTETFSGWNNGRPRLRLEGSGEIRFADNIFGASGWIDLEMCREAGAETVFTNASDSGVWTVQIPPDVAKQTIEITDTTVLFTRIVGGDDARPLVVKSDAEIKGDGTFYFGKGWNDSANIWIAPGKTLSVSAGMENYGSHGGTVKPLRILGGGTLNLDASADNKIPGNVVILEGSTVSVPVIGMSGAASPLGTGSSVTLQDGATFVYTGAGEASGDRAVSFASGGGSFLHLGSGTLALGAVSVSDDCQISVTDDAALVLASLNRTGGSVDVVLSGGASLKIADLTAGKAPVWLSVNGVPARVDGSGNIVGIDGEPDAAIDARGGEIPDLPEGVVAVTSAEGETDGVALAGSPASVYVLAQRQSVQPAVVTVATGEKLSAEIVMIDEGAKPLVVAGEGDFSGAMRLYGGDLVRSNTTSGASLALTSVGTSAELTLDGNLSESDPFSLSVSKGAVAVAGAGHSPVSKIEVLDSAEMVIEEGSVYEPGAVANLSDNEYQPVQALVVGTNSQGILSFDGGSFTGRVSVGNGNTSVYAKGAIYQTGGEIVNVLRGSSGQLPYGIYGYSYLGVSGGTFVQSGDWYLGGDMGETVVDVRGGTFTHMPATLRHTYLRIGGYDTRAVLYVADGGMFDSSDMANWSVFIPSHDRWNSNCEVTVDENGLIDFGTKEVLLGSHAKTTSGYYRHFIVNLNGGMLKAARICRFANEVVQSEEFPEGTGTSDRAGSLSFVNANGGTLYVTDATSVFGCRTTPSTQYPVARVTSFAKGLTIEVPSGKTPWIGVAGAIRAPYGKGVSSIPWNAAADGAGYIGSPVVMITGDGQGASAFAKFDPETRTVTEIVVTSPGNGYTWAKAQITYERKTVKTVDCVLADNVSGGLTVCGKGTLQVFGTNTYTGATVVKSGAKLALKADDVISPESELVLDGGTLDLGNHSQTFAGFSMTENGGLISNGKAVVTGLTVDFAKASAGDTVTADFSGITMPEGAVVKLTGYDSAALAGIRRLKLYGFVPGTAPSAKLALDPSVVLPDGWEFRQNSTGLSIVYPRGMCVICR